MAVPSSLFSVVTSGAPGRPNEDFAITTNDSAIVIDGAGVPMGGCRHGVAWYARQLGTHTMLALTANPDDALQDSLAEGIRRVRDLHKGTCNLADAGTPCAAVGVLKIDDSRVRALSLSDVAIVLETDDGPDVTCDFGIEELCGAEHHVLAGMTFGTEEHKAALAQLVARQTRSRNQPDGWWVAAADPEAAYHAKTRELSRSAVGAMAVFSDGATRPVDQMDRYKWSEYMPMLAKLGPAGIIAVVRDLEKSDPDGARFPRTKRHDDATIAAYE